MSPVHSALCLAVSVLLALPAVHGMFGGWPRGWPHPAHTSRDLEMLAHKDFHKLLDVLRHTAGAERSLFYQTLEQLETAKDHPSTKHTFKFTNCAKPEDEIVVLSNVTLQPEPLRLPGNVTAGGGLLVKSGFGTDPVKLSVEAYARVFGEWVKAPCVDNYGSCTYDDACKLLTAVTGEMRSSSTCPPAFIKIGLPCTCPFKAGKWFLKSSTAYVKTSLPVSSAHLKVKATATYQGKLLTCAEMELEVDKS